MRLILPHAMRDALVDHAKVQYPEEACGLLAGRDNRIIRVIPLENNAPNKQAQFLITQSAFNEYLPQLRAEGLQLLGFYHSHPDADPIPSPTDMRELDNGLTLPHLLIGIYPQEAHIACWQIAWGKATPIELVITDDFSVPYRAKHTRTHTIAIILSTILSLALFIGIAVSLLPPAPKLP